MVRRQKPGIQTGDVITKVAGIAVTNPQQVADAVARQKSGDTLVLSVYSRVAGKESDVTVALGQNPNDASKAFLGVTLRVSVRFNVEPSPGDGSRSDQRQLTASAPCRPQPCKGRNRQGVEIDSVETCGKLRRVHPSLCDAHGLDCAVYRAALRGASGERLSHGECSEISELAARFMNPQAIRTG